MHIAKSKSLFVNPIIDTFDKRSVEVMKLLLLTLLFLSILTHVIVVVFYPSTLVAKDYAVSFVPVYITLVLSYMVLRWGKIKLATHSFLLGMIITQMLVVVF